MSKTILRRILQIAIRVVPVLVAAAPVVVHAIKWAD